MKKTLLIFMAFIMVLSLVACGGNNAGTNTNESNPQQSELSEEQEKILASVDAILESIGNANAAIEKIGSYMQQENFSSALSSIGTAQTEFKKAIDACGNTEELAKMKGILQSIYSKLDTLSSSSGSDSGIEDKISNVLDECETYFESMGKEIEDTWVKKYNLSDGSNNQ